MRPSFGARRQVAVIGTGIAGMAAAWLLSRRHDVTVYEQAERLGGHSNTVTVTSKRGAVPVDTGLIVFNPDTYRNLTALFELLGVKTKPSDMSFSVSMDDGNFEYAGNGLTSLFAQPSNLISPDFWSMLRDIRRFYADAPRDLANVDLEPGLTLGQYIVRGGYGTAFRDKHLLPMAAAIWSASTKTMLDHPAASFIRFFDNHGLLKLSGRPQWYTVVGGSRTYVQRLTSTFADRVNLASPVARVTRSANSVLVTERQGRTRQFDHAVIATHADQALRLLADPDPDERRLLGAFRYNRNVAVLHTDENAMPLRRSVWSSWNYVQRQGAQDTPASVTYWMNKLQDLQTDEPLFVTLNPVGWATENKTIRAEVYEHPVLDVAASKAQRQLWSLQGKRNTWFCGAYFGAGFHEDGLQAGLAVAEDLGGEPRPWSIAADSDRICRRDVKLLESITEQLS